jgi:hypothetical protein
MNRTSQWRKEQEEWAMITKCQLHKQGSQGRKRTARTHWLCLRKSRKASKRMRCFSGHKRRPVLRQVHNAGVLEMHYIASTYFSPSQVWSQVWKSSTKTNQWGQKVSFSAEKDNWRTWLKDHAT